MITEKAGTSIEVAHLGNSIQYFNDCPRILQQMLTASHKFEKVYQNSCLCGGASLQTLLESGNGMETKFGVNDIGAATVTELLQEREWDFIILNDQTQSPARETSRKRAMKALTDQYLGLFSTRATIIFLQTAAYLHPGINHSADLGSFEEFTDRIDLGCSEYTKIVPNSVVAPFGNAFRMVKNYDRALWERLYTKDGFHPSPHGTYLEVCVLYCTMVQEMPPAYDKSWWEKARYMHPLSQGPLSLPTDEEAITLRKIACHTCGVEAA